MLKLKFSAPLLLAAATLGGTAHADFQCTVSVVSVLAYYQGTVNIRHSGRGDFTHICNLNEPYTRVLTVQPSACAMWTAMLLRAKKNNQPVTFYDTGSGTCAELPTYDGAPVPVYIGEQ